MNPHPIISLRLGVAATHHVAKSMPQSRNYVEWGVEVRWREWFLWAEPKKTWRQYEL